MVDGTTTFPSRLLRFHAFMNGIGWWVARRLVSVAIFTAMIVMFMDAPSGLTKAIVVWVGIAGLVYQVSNITLRVSKYQTGTRSPEELHRAAAH